MKTLFCILLLISSHLYGQVNLNQGLVLYLPFNGNTQDASGNGNNATNSGATLTSDQFGVPNSAYLFNGTSNYMFVPNNPTLQMTSTTLVARVKVNGYYSGLCYNNSILDKGNGGNASGSYSLIYTPTLNQNSATYCYTPDTLFQNYRVTVGNGSQASLNCINSTNAIPYVDTNDWDCVVGTFNDTTKIGTIYVNGILRYSYLWPAGIAGFNSSNLFIGGTTSVNYPYFVNGKLDELRVYNRVLNNQEIDALCNNCSSNLPVITNLPNINFCEGSSLAFNLQANNFNSVLWSPATGLSNTNVVNPMCNISTTTTYTVTVSNSAGCSITQSVTAMVNPAPTIQISSHPANVCLGDTLTLSALGGNSYQWSGGVVNGIPFSPTGTSNYTVVGVDANGCSNSATTTVVVHTPSTITLTNSNPEYCLPDTSILEASGMLSYTWSPSSGLNTTIGNTVIASPSSTTTYTVTGVDSKGCSTTNSTTVEVKDDIEVSITQIGNINCDAQGVQLVASGAQNFVWEPKHLLTSPNSHITQANISTTTTFTVIGTTGSCSDTAAITIEYTNLGDNRIWIPNAFSPNYDGINDCFAIITRENVREFYLAIYNRWGQLVFESDDVMNCWEGFFQNDRASADTYYYYLKGKDQCGEFFRKGDIILIR